MLPFADILDEYQQHNKIYCFEGDSGLQKFEGLLKDIGYSGHGFRFGTPIEAFLSDNPGAVDALVQWIAENGNEEWQNNLETTLPEREEENDD